MSEMRREVESLKEKPQGLSEVQLEGDERLDALREGRWIIQRARGHKATTDDQLLAWACLRALDELRLNPLTFGEVSLLELGAGKGTVTLWLSCQLIGPFVGLEAFEQSYRLSLKNRALNQLEGSFFPLHADLRDPTSWQRARATLQAALADPLAEPFCATPLPLSDLSDQALPRFTLVCGAPPFMPLGSGVMPQDPQRAAGRFELKGGVEGYLDAVVACLAPTGRALILVDGLGEARALNAARSRGLEVRRVTRVCPRPQQPATYAILSLSLPLSPLLPDQTEADTKADIKPDITPDTNAQRDALDAYTLEVLCMREREGGAWSEAYQRVLSQLRSPSSNASS